MMRGSVFLDGANEVLFRWQLSRSKESTVGLQNLTELREVFTRRLKDSSIADVCKEDQVIKTNVDQKVCG
jgi:hypothetical protein